jgi:hypothetical protein
MVSVRNRLTAARSLHHLVVWVVRKGKPVALGRDQAAAECAYKCLILVSYCWPT